MSKQHERFKYRILRQGKNIVWFLDYIAWLLFSPYKFKRKPRDFSSILVVEDIGIGDILVSTPVFHALKISYPHATIDVLVKESVEDVLFGNPHINNVITIVEKDYDLGILLHARTNGNYQMSNILRRHCNFRVGCTRVGFFEGKGFFLHRKTRPNFRIKHKTKDNLDVIRTTLGITGDTKLEAYTDFIPPLKNYNVFHTHGAYETHNWEKNKWAQLIDATKGTVVLTGSDQLYAKEIISLCKKKDVVNVVGSPIKEYFGWVKHANTVVTVDTSAMHIAAAFNKKVISLFGAGDPRIWRPLCKESFIILKGDCHSCHKNTCALGDKRCMTLIEPNDILGNL